MIWITRAWLWCVDPVCSHDGKPSHPKLLTWAILACFAFNRPLPVVVVVALLAASFGLKAFLMFLQRGTFTGASTDSRSVTESIVATVQARRIVADGIEASE